MNVADLARGERDSAGVEVLQFYARKLPDYAVYRTRERVTIHFADAPDKADAQRKALAPLAPLRGELNGLVDGWREAPIRPAGWLRQLAGEGSGRGLRARAARYDRRVADALVVALEGDRASAQAVLEGIRADVLAERVGWARFQYLLVAAAAALVFVSLASLVAAFQGRGGCLTAVDPRCFEHAPDLWRGGMGGALGGFFSIALAIRGRTVLPDLNRRANALDAALRVTIAIIAGTVFVALLRSGVVQLAIAGSATAASDALYIGLAGFLAGFSERLVPDLLAKAEARADLPPPVAGTPAAAGGAAVAAADPPPAAPAPEADGSAEADAGETHGDGCLADTSLTEAELTPDAMLPPASGGVAPAPEEPTR